jgi:hypothetical protein
MYILVGQTPEVIREVYTIGRDDTAKPPTATKQACSCCWNA